jgi:integrase
MADTRYLKQRRQTWYLNLKVPADVQAAMGRAHITQTLETRDLSVAQRKRWELVNEYMARFEVLRGQRELTPAEIEEHARKAFHDALKEFDEFDYDDESLDMDIELAGDRMDSGKLSDLDYALTHARIKAGIARRTALSGEQYDIPETFGRSGIDPVTLQPVLRKAGGSGIKFSVAAQDYIAEKQRDAAAKLTEQTRGQYEAVYRLFASWANDPTLDAVEVSDAADFLDQVAKLDPNWGRSPKTKERTFADIALLFGDHETGLSNRTINRYATALSQVWTWTKTRGRFNGSDPWEHQQRRTGEARKTQKLPFNPEQVAVLLSDAPEIKPDKYGAATTLPWACLISAYSGMRLNEICSLRSADLRAEDGVHYFDVNNAKTEAGDRRVPIHSRIIEAGLLEFAKHGDEWLFPGLRAGGPDAKRGWYLSRAFTTHRRGLGLTKINPITQKDQLDFHSFRRSAIRALEEARVPQSEAAQVVGHERAGITYGTYNVEGLSLAALKDVVEKIRHPAAEAQQ